MSTSRLVKNRGIESGPNLLKRWITFVFGVEVSNVSDFLCGEEDSYFIEEEVEEMR